MKGHVYKRGKTWTTVLDYGKDPFSGKRQQKSKGGFRTKKEADMYIAKIIVADAKATNSRNLLFHELAEEWFEQYKTIGVKISTIETVQCNIIALNKMMNSTYIKDIDTVFLERLFKNYLVQYKKNTLNGLKGSLSNILKYAVKSKYISQNPLNDFTMPRKPTTIEEAAVPELPKFLEKKELLQLLEHAKKNTHYQIYAMYHVLSYTGIRIGELLALKWEDFDSDNKTLRIYKTLFNRKERFDTYHLLPPKSKTSNRIIDLDLNTIQVLKKLKTVQNEVKLNCENYHDENFIFINLNNRHYGYPSTKRTAIYSLKKDLEACSLPYNLTNHSFRHTHTSLLAEAGVDLISIMNRLGHSKDEITKRIYIHATEKTRADAVSKFAEHMKSV